MSAFHSMSSPLFFLLAFVLVCSIMSNSVQSVPALSNCDPLDTERCFLPFPNNFFLRDGRIALDGHESMPIDDKGYSMNS